MEEADKDWMMIRMVGGWVFLLVPAHPGSPRQRAIKRSLLLCCCTISILTAIFYVNLFRFCLGFLSPVLEEKLAVT